MLGGFANQAASAGAVRQGGNGMVYPQLFADPVRAPYLLLPTQPIEDKPSQSNTSNIPVVYFTAQQLPAALVQPQTARIISNFAFLPPGRGNQATFGST